MNATEPIGGQLWLRPGAPCPRNLRSTRPDWVGRVTRGLPASRLPATLGHLFSLCGHAHVSCAVRAVAAAQGRRTVVPAAAYEELATLTLREHLRRIWLDWPGLLSATPPPEAALQAGGYLLAQCPAWAAKPPGGPLYRIDGLAPWLETHVFGMPLAAWLDAWEHAPGAWLAAWCVTADTLPARLLRGSRSFDSSAPLAGVPLRVHADEAALRTWAAALQTGGSDFARQPRWQGACAETGPWTRLADPASARADTPRQRLGARLAEVARLALPHSAAPGRADGNRASLQLGALSLSAGSGLAWVEMARGLLIHHVQLDSTAEDARVSACRVIAPTDWNFHPEGAFAQALEALPPGAEPDTRRALGVLIAAYDPCVPYRLELPTPREVAHA